LDGPKRLKYSAKIDSPILTRRFFPNGYAVVAGQFAPFRTHDSRMIKAAFSETTFFCSEQTMKGKYEI
jgi:hypothetical protein